MDYNDSTDDYCVPGLQINVELRLQTLSPEPLADQATQSARPIYSDDAQSTTSVIISGSQVATPRTNTDPDEAQTGITFITDAVLSDRQA